MEDKFMKNFILMVENKPINDFEVWKYAKFLGFEEIVIRIWKQKQENEGGN